MKRKKLLQISALILSALLVFNSFSMPVKVFADEDYSEDSDSDDFDDDDDDDGDGDQPEEEPEEPQEEPEEPSEEPKEEPKPEPQAAVQAAVFPSVYFETDEGDGLPAGKTIEIRNPNGFDVTTSVAVVEVKDSVDFQVSGFPQSMAANSSVKIDVIPVQKGGSLAAGNYNATLQITAASGGQSISATQPVQLKVNKKADEKKDEQEEEEEASKQKQKEKEEEASKQKQQEEEASKQKQKEQEEEASKQKQQEEEASKQKEQEEASNQKQQEEEASKQKQKEQEEEASKQKEESSKAEKSSIHVTPGDATIMAGGNMSFTAKVTGNNNPSQSVKWSVSGGSKGTKITGDGTLIVDANESATKLQVTATSTAYKNVTGSVNVKITKDGKKATKTITVAADPQKGGKVAGGGSYKQGDKVTVIAVANNGYKFTGWMKNGTTKVSTANTYHFKMGDENEGYLAKFERVSCTVRVSANHDSRGKVSGGGTVEYGGSMKLKAEPKDDNRFRGWRENDKIISKDKKLELTNITTDRDIEAVFDKKGYKVTVNKNYNEGGVIKGEGTYDDGDTVRLSVSIANGYRFDGWYLNNQKVSNAMDYKIENINRDLNFNAVFIKDGVKTYTITSGVAQQGKGGVISPQGTTQVAAGASFTYVIAPGNGYKILAVAVDGQQVGAVNTYTFTNVNSDHTIAVAFAPDANAVVKQTMQKIITTEEAAAIASAKLETGGSMDGRASVISESSGDSGSSSSSSRGAAVSAGSGKSDTDRSDSGDSKKAMEPVIEETISIDDLDKEEDGNLIGMDGAEDLTEDSVEDMTFATGIYATLGTTPEMARQMVDSGDDTLLLKTAYDDGYLRLNINNQFSRDEGLQDLDLSSPLETNATIKNVNEFVKGVLTADEKMYMFDGNEISLNLDVSQAEPSSDTVKALNSVKGVESVGYFDIAFMKSEMDMPELMSELPVEMELVLKVPEDMKEDSGKLCVVREHDGEVDVLEDLDDDPDTVTFRTDRLSAYSFAYENGKSGVNWLVVGIVSALLVAVLVIALVFAQRSRRVKATARRRRRESAHRRSQDSKYY